MLFKTALCLSLVHGTLHPLALTEQLLCHLLGQDKIHGSLLVPTVPDGQVELPLLQSYLVSLTTCTLSECPVDVLDLVI